MKLPLRRVALAARATVLMIGLLSLGLGESREASLAAAPPTEFDAAALAAAMPVVGRGSWEQLFVGR